jgi:hypothetical protein
MGGGTTIIEGLALGRRLIGIDINSLAHFVTTVRTRPISTQDEDMIRLWAQLVADYAGGLDVAWIQRVRVRNLPEPVGLFMSGALSLTATMPPRQRAFARCALLRLGQWALDCRDFAAPSRKRLACHLVELVEEMFGGLREFRRASLAANLLDSRLVRNRHLINRDAVGLEEEPIFAE